MKRPLLSVILPVCTWTSLAQQCLYALFATLPKRLDAEVLVVTDTSAMPPQLLAGYGERLRLVHTDESSGFSASCNVGAEEAEGDYLVFLHHATEPQPGWLTALLEEIEAHPAAVAIGSQLRALNGTIDHAGIVIGQDRSPVTRYRGFPANHPAVTTPRCVTAVSAFGSLVRRARFMAVAGFDTAFTTSLCDVDFGLRLRELGGEIWYCPASILYHYASADPATESEVPDQQLYRERWGHRVHADDVQHYLDDGLLAFTYQESYPIQINVSPMLAIVDGTEMEYETARLLDLRTRQVSDLLKETTRQTVAQSASMIRQFQTPIETVAKAKLHALLMSRQRLALPSVAQPRVSIVIPLYNQAHYLYLTLENLLATPGKVPFEVILVDDASVDATPQLLDCLDNVRVHVHAENEGFGEACNHGAALARGEFVCFLNSDVLTMPGWLDALVETMDCHPECGAAGAKLVFTDGTLQEAGSILWRDGSALGYGRGDNPSAPEYSYAREVDYCSAACLLVRREVFAAVGGFDPRYSPAYYEDVDLCLSIWDAGNTVRYTAQAAVLHLEHASSGRDRAIALQLRNRAALMEKWPDLDRDHGAPGTDIVRWRERRTGTRVLVVDDLVPFMSIGSGFPRTAALLDALVAAGYVVSYLPATDPTPREPMTRALQSQGVEVLHSTPDTRAQIAARRGYYDIAIVSRPHNAPLMGAIRAANPGIAIIYDAEALFTLREANQSRIMGTPLASGELERRIRAELAVIGSADLVFTVSEIERKAIERYHPQVPLAIWGHAIATRGDVPGFAARQGLGFLGYLASAPNNDAVLFFLRNIFPIIQSRLDIPLTIAGIGVSSDVRSAAAAFADRVTLAGYVEDLIEFFDRCRVFVAPHRFAAGIPLKVVEAMANGVPCVVSQLLGEQLGITDGVEALIASDAEDFAMQVVRLYEDGALWRRVQKNAFRFVREFYDPTRMRDVLRDQIDGLLARRLESDARNRTLGQPREGDLTDPRHTKNQSQ